MASRRGFLGALAGVPVLIPLAKAEPTDDHVEQPIRFVPRADAGRKEEMALLVWKDGHRERVTLTAPLGRRIFKARWLRPQNTSAFLRDSAPRFGVDMEQIAFERTTKLACFSSSGDSFGKPLPVYEEA
jgi:hypothetical protein